MKKFILTTAVILVFILCFSESSYCGLPDSTFKPMTRRNSISFEFGGNCLIYSLNYERVIFAGTSYDFSAKLGYSYIGQGFYFTDCTSLLLCNRFGKAKVCQFELDGGIAFTNLTDEEYKEILISTFAGLRCNAPRGFTFRAGISPFIFTDDSQFQIWAGISFGYSF